MNKEPFGVFTPSIENKKQELIEATKKEGNPYILICVDFSEDEKGIFISTIKGERNILYSMLQTVLEYI